MGARGAETVVWSDQLLIKTELVRARQQPGWCRPPFPALLGVARSHGSLLGRREFHLRAGPDQTIPKCGQGGVPSW